MVCDGVCDDNRNIRGVKFSIALLSDLLNSLLSALSRLNDDYSIYQGSKMNPVFIETEGIQYHAGDT